MFSQSLSPSLAALLTVSLTSLASWLSYTLQGLDAEPGLVHGS
ncbi:ORF4 [Barthadenovirus mellis]|uniref:ORF4 n=1 Tax=Passerine adenovirus 1 TaxID=2779174 RepID=A0A7M4BDC9_9ADEN|nr:ORF4 [Passerine adenovirus 1]